MISQAWKVGVIGAGWSGLAAAVTLQQAGAQVTMWDMAPQAGGRARSGSVDRTSDNGQHILIGAYRQTLSLMAEVGIDVDSVTRRLPLHLTDATGLGLQARPELSRWPSLALVDALLRHPGWSWPERMSTLRWLITRSLGQFQCDPELSVADLTAQLPMAVRQTWIDPLCVAALNTPSHEASAQVFLTVLRAVAHGGSGATDLLIPTQGLHHLLPGPAMTWLRRGGCAIHLGHRVQRVQRLIEAGPGWEVDGERVDQLVLAASAKEASRLTSRINPSWAACAAQLPFSPITTAYVRGASQLSNTPMVMLADGPAQFAFDLGRLGASHGLWSIVSSAPDLSAFDSTAELGTAMLNQLMEALGVASDSGPVWRIESVQTDKRATLLCRPRLSRPPLAVAPGWVAAGDYVQGPFPSTLEGAVMAGRVAAHALVAQRGESAA